MPRRSVHARPVARRPVAWAASALTAVALAGCAEDSPEEATPPASSSGAAGGEATDDAATAPEGRFPDIEQVELTPAGEGAFDVFVTVSSPYDTPEQYADGWRVLAPDGTVLGEHQLLHDHAGEQPFTRVQSGVVIPADVEEVTVEGRDLVNGYGGGTRTVPVPR
jgi:uncharacterized lipoprotein YbaY